MDLHRELEAAEAVAREAGDILMRRYRGEYRVDLKAGEEPVTEADRASNRHVVRRLREEFPQDAVLAEESSEGAEGLAGASRMWLVDPMDGTKEFINHTDEFAVMIGLVLEGRPVLGVVNQPATGTLYRGVVGDGADEVTATGTRSMRVTATEEPSALRLIVSRSHTPEIVVRMAERLGIDGMARSGSVGLKIGRIATATCDLYLHPSGGTKLWDAAAPEAILHAAGGRLTDFDGEPVAYDPRHLHNDRGLLASNGAAHDVVLERLAGMF